MEPETNRETAQQADSLLRDAINNDREALDELFARYRRRLYHRALRLMGNSEDAEDAVQDGLLSAFRNLSQFEGRSGFSTWLTSFIINAALMQIRRGRPEVVTSIDQQLDRHDQPWANRIPNPGPNPEEMYARRERVQILERTLQSLPAAYRRAPWLCHVQGMSTTEAAEAWDCRSGRSNLNSTAHGLGLARRPLRPGMRNGFFKGRGDAAMARHRPTLELTEKITQPAG